MARRSFWPSVHCPQHRKTGGKVRPNRKRPRINRAAQALRLAEQRLRHKQSVLGTFYRRMRAPQGAPKAIAATANKLARLIYRLLKCGREYMSQSLTEYEARMRAQQERTLRQKALAMGFDQVSRAPAAVS